MSTGISAASAPVRSHHPDPVPAVGVPSGHLPTGDRPHDAGHDGAAPTGAAPTGAATTATDTAEGAASSSGVNPPSTPPVRRPAPLPTPRSKMWTVKFVLLLGLMVAIGAFTTDMYLPSLPEVGRDLGAGDAAVQFTITATLIGGALGQFVIGPLSDRYGRRVPAMIGITVHIVASVACLLTYDVMPLIGLRILQGVGNAAAAVVAIAVIRDKLTGPQASAVLSRLMLVIGLAPLLAPSIGGFLANIWNWRAVFVALALYGVGLLVVVWRFLPETLPPARRTGGSPLKVLGSYGALLRDRQFVALALLPGLGMAAVFAYVSASPFVIREDYGLSENEFALLFALNGISMVIGAQVNAALVRRFAPVRLLRLALPVSVSLAMVLVVVAALGLGGLPGLLAPLWLMMGVNAFIAPNASASALARHGDRAGAAAALIGVSQFGVAGLVAPLTGLFGTSATSMAVVIAASMAAALLVLALGTPAYRRGGWRTDAAFQE
ncbi:multidrug effflux MFS transporter [Pseudactinotalea sp. Z1748]|uniref:multidrug effflux MFS transporter n=1 Tax=Pseudactinotalea sp. Z1748 TaxID=3413027 RepID=UPI003C7CE986